MILCRPVEVPITFAPFLRRYGITAAVLMLSAVPAVCSAADSADAPATVVSRLEQISGFFEAHCLDCHNDSDRTADLTLESFDPSGKGNAADREQWETVIRRLAARQMPPSDMPRPDEDAYDQTVSAIASLIDEQYEKRPQPGRTETFRRLNRTEYGNAIRDLLGLEIDVAALLPADEAGHGFDNVTVADLSPMLMGRYITAAEKISRLAAGGRSGSPEGDTIRFPPDRTQEAHVEGLPLGTRGGGVIRYHFPRDGEYRIEIRLMRDRNEHVEGLTEPHDLEVLLDRRLLAEFTVKPARRGEGDSVIDAHLNAKIKVSAGTHDLGVTFRKKPTQLLETKRQPLNARFNYHRHPRTTPAIYEVTITGPHIDEGPGETESRRRVFISRPEQHDNEEACAEEIVAALVRRAYRRPPRDEDIARPMEFYRGAREDGDFDSAIEAALAAVLVNPRFLFKIELDPPELPPATAYRLSDLELASRLSFFLWSSIPDDELLEAAEAGWLSDPEVLDLQLQRMLADPRSESLISNFGGQWLYLRNLDSITPDVRLFPDFDDNLRQSFRRETEMLLESIVRDDRSVLELLKTGETFLDERLAKHYEIPHVYGSRFRRVALDGASVRGGLLRHGSVLTVTSYATRTSPVIRGQWVLKNIIGIPPPPPPPDIPELEDAPAIAETLSVRERLAAHRVNPACASCHDLIDPIGFALENFDAVGRWRDYELGRPVDASGGLPDGSEFTGVEGLEEGLLQRPELFVAALVEKLLVFALGRGVTAEDGPVVRSIVREARQNDYRFSSIVTAIVHSPPFQMRTTP